MTADAHKIADALATASTSAAVYVAEGPWAALLAAVVFGIGLALVRALWHVGDGIGLAIKARVLRKAGVPLDSGFLKSGDQ